MFVREREKESRDGNTEGKGSFDHTGVSLMSCSSLSEHLRYTTGVDESERRAAEKRHQLVIF